MPNAPSPAPGDKRLAVHVEDHPLDDADFQGRIPAGQNGAGTVETRAAATVRQILLPPISGLP